jgi:transcriptional regulator with XRE-family HTH domain
MTQRELAKACRSSENTIMDVENDKRDLHAFLFMEIGKVLGTSLDWLAFGKTESA